MSKVKLVSLLTLGVGSLLIVLSLFIKAQYFDDGNFLTTKTIRADAVWRIGAAGSDMRFYEITPPSAPYMLCVAFTGTNKMADDCFRKLDFDVEKYLADKKLEAVRVQ